MRSYADAVAWVKGQVKSPSQDWNNLCQMISRTAVGADAWAPSAREAFNQIPASHKHSSWPPPAGSICYWGNPDYGFGHATFVGDGVLYSNDIYRKGKIDPVKLTKQASQMPFVTDWGLAYRGWIDWTPSGPINLKTQTAHDLHLAHLAHAGKPAASPTPTHLTAHQQHLLHLANQNKPLVPAGTGEGPYWLLRWLRAHASEVGVYERVWWALLMRESGGRADCLYPAGAPWGDWVNGGGRKFDVGLFQCNVVHLPMARKMFGASTDMRVFLDPEKAWQFARRYLSWGDWGLVPASDGKSVKFDWSGYPASWVQSYAAASEKSFKYWWDMYPVAVRKVYPSAA